MKKQRTLKNSFSLEGKGLHSGLKTTISFNPAPDNYGYKIKRTDIMGQPIINALAENVIDSQRGTTLYENGASAGSVEHALAALYASEIDNCLIEINGPEFPALDGSSILYLSKIKEIGTEEQNAPRKYVSLKRKRIRIVDKENDSSMVLMPGNSFDIKTKITFDSPLLKSQSASLGNLSDFTKEIASARTFAFIKEIEPMIRENLIKGGNLDNSIIIYDTILPQSELDRIADLIGVKHRDARKLGYIMNKPLAYSNELARHKLLDVIGDLALVGAFIKGSVTAIRPGHLINNQFAMAIREYYITEIESKEKKSIKTEDMPFELSAIRDDIFCWNRL
ncbi:UDP-3-O-acyl-N-acetylglucosamine deacetylase [Dysgonomonas sp. Marseille-P4677]|uniref:UDP-3-O-acyl-N-acetylglucosamine deacetylase n=1 Tax=Dysgonomonas sp. Marseille-P4677 TaxID=2364790 RepID=UPI0019118F4A|nr:UDP-3-O-acyl-N-acetylglucosamine deacetylase [Dysgonomonas sp. Marseille-P4677]MBK5720887.1 UDP-3-O-acyl-N-acetylglucosamine deacetylase [Dysgonomonas sp. Marseille-P4677]